MTPRTAIAAAGGDAQNGFQSGKKEGTSARRALRYCPLWRSDGDYTLFGAAVDRLRIRSVSRTGAANSVTATHPSRVGICLHETASSLSPSRRAMALSRNGIVR